MLMSWHAGRLRRGSGVNVSPQLQAMIFFSGCVVVGLAMMVLTIVGVLRDPVVGVGGAVGAAGGIYVLVRGAAYIRSGKGSER